MFMRPALHALPLHQRARCCARSVLPFVLCTLLAACSDNALAPEVRDLNRAEAIWHEQALTSYTMIQSRSCFCIDGGQEFLVTVGNNQIVRVVRRSNGAQLPIDQHAYFRTVDQLFDAIHNAIRQRGVLREVHYHSANGYPTFVSLDPVLNAVDDEIAYASTLTNTPN